MRLSLNLPRSDERPFDVVGFGLNSVDLLAVVAEYPAVNTKQRLQRLTRLPGGQIATAMAACAKLGWRASYVGAFGGDDLGALSRDSLIEAGVDITPAGPLRTPPTSSALSWSTHDRASERCCGIGIQVWRGTPMTCRERLSPRAGC